MKTPDRRRGYALIEMVVTMTVLAALLGLCVGTIHLLMRLDRAGREAGDEAADVFRLARDFRADARAATDAEPPAPSSERFAMALPGGRAVEYTVRPDDLMRTVRKGDRVVAREMYRRRPRSSVAFAVDRPSGSPPFVVLRVGRPPEGQPDGPARVQEIEAEFGKDHRRFPGGRP
jgi:prepilin-type N-terminal cleavage/methylation domain-containing protein